MLVNIIREDIYKQPIYAIDIHKLHDRAKFT